MTTAEQSVQRWKAFFAARNVILKKKKQGTPENVRLRAIWFSLSDRDMRESFRYAEEDRNVFIYADGSILLWKEGEPYASLAKCGDAVKLCESRIASWDGNAWHIDVDLRMEQSYPIFEWDEDAYASLKEWAATPEFLKEHSYWLAVYVHQVRVRGEALIKGIFPCTNKYKDAHIKKFLEEFEDKAKAAEVHEICSCPLPITAIS